MGQHRTALPLSRQLTGVERSPAYRPARLRPQCLAVRFDNGVVGQLVTSWAYDPPLSTERFSVVGERGSLHSDGRSLTVTLRGSSSQTYDFDEVDAYASEIGHFAACLRSGIRPVHTEKEGIDVLCLILAAYEGARRRTIAPIFWRSDI
jgi:predicted dehydrogenase